MIRSKSLRKFGSMVLASCLVFFQFACQNELQARDNPDDNPPTTKSIKMALILDTSGSMDGLIDQAKAQLWNVVNELARAKCDGVRPTMQIAVYQYGNDGLPASEGYIQMVQSLTSDLDEISKSLFALSTNGGSEFCGQAIQSSLNQLDWNESPEDYKVIFIAGNEGFNQGSVDYKFVCGIAKEKGIIVNTIHCGDLQAGINGYWKDGADLTGGKYLSINQNSKTEYIPSPYDQQISNLNDSLNTTYIQYGANGFYGFSNMSSQDDNASGYGLGNKVSRSVSKSTAAYDNSGWDLVDAKKAKDFKLKEVENSTLPKNMQSMTLVEKEKYVAAQSAKRTIIKNDIATLDEKRRKFLAAKNAENASKNQLGGALISTVREQAQNLNFSFSES